MNFSNRELPPNLPLDDEYVDTWSIEASFRGDNRPIHIERALELIRIDQETHGTDSLFQTAITSSDLIVISLFANEVHGTQEAALRRTTQRYRRLLGAIAVKENLIVAKMNLRSIIIAHLAAHLPSETTIVNRLDYLTDEEIAQTGNISEAPKLDVTTHVARLLDEMN